MSLRRAHSLALRAERATREAQDTGSEKQLRAARQLHAQASHAFEEAGDARQARYHLLKARELYHAIHRHDPDPSDPYHRGARENPLIADDWLRIGVGIALVAGLGFMFWQKSQENETSSAAPAVPAPPGVPAVTSTTASLMATDINPGPAPPPSPPPTAGGVPLPVAPA